MKPSRAKVIAHTKGALRGHAKMRHLLTPELIEGGYHGLGYQRERELKARLKRARTPIARPKGRLPNDSGKRDSAGSVDVIRYWVSPEPMSRVGWNVKGVVVNAEGKEVGNSPQKWIYTKTKREAKHIAQMLNAELKRFKRYRAINPGFFGFESGATKPQRVTKIRPVIARADGERGEIVGTAPGGYVKVQWRNRAKPTLIKRSEIRRGRYPNVRVNPGLLELASGLSMAKELAKQKVRNPSGRTSTEVRSPTKTSTKTYARTEGNITVTGGAGAGATTKVIVRKNPSVRAISEKFQGRVSGAITELKAASNAPSDLARIGKLIELRIQGRASALRIPGAVVAADTKERLWIAGNRSPLFTQKARPGTLLDCGEIDKIVYLTAKKHIGDGETFEYDHDFENPKPRLMINSEGMPIIRGGGYTIKAGGITG